MHAKLAAERLTLDRVELMRDRVLLHREFDAFGVCFEADGSFRASQGSTDGFDGFESRECAEGFDVRARPGAAFEHGEP